MFNMEEDSMDKLWPRMMNYELTPLTKKKMIDLYEHGVHLSRDENNTDFLHQYPFPQESDSLNNTDNKSDGEA